MSPVFVPVAGAFGREAPLTHVQKLVIPSSGAAQFQHGGPASDAREVVGVAVVEDVSDAREVVGVAVVGDDKGGAAHADAACLTRNAR